eukprot:COSAG05_NODE_1138_length_5750_cov_15.376747_4_plen_107_part_00
MGDGIAVVGFLGLVLPSAARGIFVRPSLAQLGRRATICGTSVAVGVGSVKLLQQKDGAPDGASEVAAWVALGSATTGVVAGSWTIGHATRCAVQLGYEALTGGPRA